MSTFKEAMSRLSAAATKRWPAVSSDDVEQQAWLEVIAVEDIPPLVKEWLYQVVSKVANRHHMRQRRYKERPQGEFDNEPRADLEGKATYRAVMTNSEIFNNVLPVTESEFDRETILVLLGDHLEFNSFRQLARARYPRSLSTAYRAKKQLLCRVRKLYENEVV